ncbi:MAG: iron-sulfur cluster assembly scaffold protein [Thermodesulfobacteriota bacterium]
MTEKPFDFWQDHSDHFLEMAFRADRLERLAAPDGYGKNTGDCGDTIEMFVTVDNDRITTLTFAIDGCSHTRACANTVAHLVEGKPVQQAWEMTAEHIAEFLQTLPDDSYHCAELAVGALYRALRNYQVLQRDSWKKAYPNR